MRSRDFPLSSVAYESEADALLEQAQASGLGVITYADAEFPASLREIPHAPVVLWVAGRVSALSPPVVAVVGSRAASSGGMEVAERLGHDLAAAGVTVVSGLARGCDAAAHRGALAAGGLTIAVLGCGADVVYPAEHRGLYQRIRDTGAIVSELAPGSPPLPAHFPQRNRIISGLARGVVVVEASDKSGSLITAACALEQGRDVMAVPGSILGSRHRGCHALLRDGARLVETAADVLEELGIDGSGHRRAPRCHPGTRSAAHAACDGRGWRSRSAGRALRASRVGSAAAAARAGAGRPRAARAGGPVRPGWRVVVRLGAPYGQNRS